MKIKSQPPAPQPQTIPRIWERMSLPQRQQLARQIAALIRQVRQSTPKKEQSSNE